MTGLLAAGLFGMIGTGQLGAEPLKIGYSDWPGWIAWEIGIKKGWFKEAGVEVDFVWMDYVESIDAYVAGKVDAVSMTNRDALVTGATGKPSVGIIYDLLYVSPGSLDSRKEDWAKVVGVWYKIAAFIRDEENLDETLEILSARVGIKPEEYESFLKGAYILTLEEALERWENKEGLGSVYGSSKVVDDFNVKFEVYEKPLDVEKYLNPSFTKAYAASLKSE